ncbi:hypothetical protein A0W34_14930 [Rhodococcus sp. BH4]|nr:hypothetical protein A0W34_14930 [Rhodococcus sp. BH4]
MHDRLDDRQVPADARNLSVSAIVSAPAVQWKRGKLSVISSTAHKHEPLHGRRPPADHRFLGFDTRVFPHALAILAVWMLWTVIVPAIDSAVSSEDPTGAGDRMAVTETVSFAAPAGWNVDSGFRTDQHGASDSLPRVTLTDGTVTVSVDADTFSGTADELLSQTDAVSLATNGSSVLAVSGARQPISTDGGLSGVQVSFDTPRSAGSVTTFVVDGKGIRVQVVGPPDQIAARSREITDMIASIGTHEEDTK